jgi:hypothetical protein
MTPAQADREAQTEWLQVVYELEARPPVEPLERAIGEACRRHRAHPRDVDVQVRLPVDATTPTSVTLGTPIPVSHDGRAGAALLRDIETILAQAAPGAWRRLTCAITTRSPDAAEPSQRGPWP